MRRLVVAVASFGLVLGIVSAVVAHFLPIGDFGWFAYTPLESAYRSGLSVTLTPDWWPSIVVVPAVGLVAGAVTGVVLGRLGWRLTRSPGTSP